MIGVVAILTIQPDKQAEFEAIMMDLTEQVNANEPNANFYKLYKQKDTETTYVVMEEYTDDAALAAHRQTEHFKAAGPKLATCLAAPPDVKVYKAI